MAADDESTRATRQIYLPDISILEEIVNSTTGLFHNNEEEAICRRMVLESLSEQEQDAAASTSYAYWAWKKIQPSGPSSISKDSSRRDEEIRVRMAMREARRHFVGQNGNYEAAVERLKHTVHWRKDSKIDLLRCCFAQTSVYNGTSNVVHTIYIPLSDEDYQFCQRMERLIEQDLSIQIMAVRGRDKYKRPIILRFPRQSAWSKETDSSSEEEEDSFRWAQLYMAERAIAVAEIKSLGQSELLTVFFDFGSYDSKNSPPIGVMIRTVTMLQANYPERLGTAVVLDVPIWINAAIGVVRPFLSVKTREKLVVLASSSPMAVSLWRPFSSSSIDSATIRDTVIRKLVDKDQAMSRFRDDGQLNSAIDIARQLRYVPFFELYDFDTEASTCCSTTTT